MNADDAKRLKELSVGNRRLKKVVADLTLDKQILEKALKEKWYARRGHWPGGAPSPSPVSILSRAPASAQLISPPTTTRQSSRRSIAQGNRILGFWTGCRVAHHQATRFSERQARSSCCNSVLRARFRENAIVLVYCDSLILGTHAVLNLIGLNMHVGGSLFLRPGLFGIGMITNETSVAGGELHGDINDDSIFDMTNLAGFIDVLLGIDSDLAHA